ncbi:ribonuclease 4-like [Suncus etruscus]|uniref:ribonuclease 4-like n=1 Tax=Suncus etruscus TaxID=109475 RepID=UPI00210F2683|nr:ribonuclease 4-like [Suncus etruscus]XP_049624661.1 ribonuclease 4-like [Suncus etruscus]XP_049624662.1 ribonuclease 4-like [Suncus etruscus]
MAFQKNRSLLLFLFLTLLGLGLIQPSNGQSHMYQQFLRQHVDTQGTGGSSGYCNLMMQRRGMTSPKCKPVNTFIHESISDINRICSSRNTTCKNGQMNCYRGIVRVTECTDSGAARSPNCRYWARTNTRSVVIACNGNPRVPVHFDQ